MADSNVITVACVKYGEKYNSSHVNKLYDMVGQHLKVPYEFVCLTDNPKYLKCKALPFTSQDIEGWWSKMNLFDQDSFNDWILYFDLDVIIHRNIDAFVDRKHSFNSIHDFHHRGVFNSSIMFWKKEKYRDLWNLYKNNSIHYRRSFAGDQDLITELVKPRYDWSTYPDEWTWSWKWGDIRTNVRASQKKFHLTKEAKVAVFHGRPNPWEIQPDEFDYVIQNCKKS